MKPIPELAKECGVIGTDYKKTPLNVCDKNYNFTLDELEALCKAYMQDRLSELQDVAIVDDASYYDGKTSTYKPNGNLVKQHALDYDTQRITEIPIGTCIYDISSLLEKE